MSYSSVLANAEDPGAEFKTVNTECSSPVTSVVQLCVYQLSRIILQYTIRIFLYCICVIKMYNIIYLNTNELFSNYTFKEYQSVLSSI